MLPYSSGKKWGDTRRTFLGGPLPTPLTFSKIVTLLFSGFTLCSERRQKITSSEALLALTVLTNVHEIENTEPCKLYGL